MSKALEKYKLKAKEDQNRSDKNKQLQWTVCLVLLSIVVEISPHVPIYFRRSIQAFGLLCCIGLFDYVIKEAAKNTDEPELFLQKCWVLCMIISILFLELLPLHWFLGGVASECKQVLEICILIGVVPTLIKLIQRVTGSSNESELKIKTSAPS